MIGWYCPNKFQCNSNYLPYTVDLIWTVIQYIENLMIWIQKQDKFIVIIWKKWSQRWNIFHIPWKTERWDTWLYGFKYKFIVLIWKTLDMRFGCKIRINSLHSVQLSLIQKISGQWNSYRARLRPARYEFYWPDIFPY